MARASWLNDVVEDLRRQGIPVHYVNGFAARGSDTFDPRGIICHDTGGSANSTDSGEISTLLNGSTSAPPPIAQFYLSRTTGVHLVATGRCNHARTGRAGPLKNLGNTNLIGIEAAANPGKAWPAAQYCWYVLLVAAICKRRGWNPDQHIAAHREHQPGEKVDPQGIDMARFRADIRAAMNGTTPPAPTSGVDMPLLFLVRVAGNATVRLCRDFMDNRVITSERSLATTQAALKSNNLGTTVWEWPDTPEHRELLGVNIDSVDDPDTIAVALTDAQINNLGLQIRQGVPTLDQIRGVVDQELDEQSRGGADNDA
jgi:hypothetical protein